MYNTWYEAHLSAKSQEKKKNPRLPKAYEKQSGALRAGSTAQERSETARNLTGSGFKPAAGRRNHKLFDLTRADRLKGSKIFKNLFASGQRFHRPGLLIIYQPAPRSQAAFIASKRIGNAVQRNRTKRIIREAYRMHKKEITGRLLIFYAQRNLRLNEAVRIIREFAAI